MEGNTKRHIHNLVEAGKDTERRRMLAWGVHPETASNSDPFPVGRVLCFGTGVVLYKARARCWGGGALAGSFRPLA